jgi:hypothetical protein
VQPRANASMMIIPPQHGHGRGGHKLGKTVHQFTIAVPGIRTDEKIS